MSPCARLLFGEALARLEKLVELVPAAYASYRPLIGDALLFFLGNLPEPRLQAILDEQLAMPRNASSARRATALFRHCPTLHKLGQVVARDRRLDAELRQRLQALESLPPSRIDPDVLRMIQQQTRKVSGLEVAPKALAEASVAQIIPFAWKRAPTHLPQQGVFKVLRPGVAQRLKEELAIWSRLGSYLEERCEAYGLPQFDYRSTLDSVARLLAHEIRLDREQANLTEAGQCYADWPEVLIPRLYPFCTPQMTAMERIFGQKVTESPAAAGALRQRAHLVAEALLAFPFWENGRFHADPHAGNLMVTEDGRLALLDWALMTQLSKTQCEALVQIILGALCLNRVQVAQSIAQLGRVRAPQKLQMAVSEALRQVRQGGFPGFDWLTGLLDGLASHATVEFPEEFILFRKALLTLSSVVADISGQASIDSVLLGSGAVHFFRHLGTRLFAQAGSRHTGAHLSNVDLLGLWLGSPMTLMRCCLGSF